MVVGDVKTPDVLSRVRQVFGPVPRGPQPPPVTAVEPPQIDERRLVVKKVGAQLPIVDPRAASSRRRRLGFLKTAPKAEADSASRCLRPSTDLSISHEFAKSKRPWEDELVLRRLVGQALDSFMGRRRLA